MTGNGLDSWLGMVYTSILYGYVQLPEDVYVYIYIYMIL